VSVLMIALFGQIIGAVPINGEPPPDGAYSAWTLDPLARSVTQSSFPAVWLGTAAARMTAAGHDVVMVPGGEHPFMFVEDGPDGPRRDTGSDHPRRVAHARSTASNRTDSRYAGDRPLAMPKNQREDHAADHDGPDPDNPRVVDQPPCRRYGQ
jgi:hypothetical protein